MENIINGKIEQIKNIRKIIIIIDNLKKIAKILRKPNNNIIYHKVLFDKINDCCKYIHFKINKSNLTNFNPDIHIVTLKIIYKLIYLHEFCDIKLYDEYINYFKDLQFNDVDKIKQFNFKLFVEINYLYLTNIEIFFNKDITHYI